MSVWGEPISSPERVGLGALNAHCAMLQVWTWGEPWGDFSMKVDRSPKSVAGATDIVKIACGAFHNLCLNA